MNEGIFYFFYNLAYKSVFLDNLVIFFGVVLPILILLGISIFLLLKSDIAKEKKLTKSNFTKIIKEFLIIFGPAFIAFLAATILKDLIQANRSFVRSDLIVPLFNPSQEFSFPSTHAAIFSALAFSVYFYHKKSGYIFMFFALLIGI